MWILPFSLYKSGKCHPLDLLTKPDEWHNLPRSRSVHQTEERFSGRKKAGIRYNCACLKCNGGNLHFENAVKENQETMPRWKFMRHGKACIWIQQLLCGVELAWKVSLCYLVFTEPLLKGSIVNGNFRARGLNGSYSGRWCYRASRCIGLFRKTHSSFNITLGCCGCAVLLARLCSSEEQGPPCVSTRQRAQRKEGRLEKRPRD